MAFTKPGSLWKNGYVESFNSKLHDELLKAKVFDTLLEARVVAVAMAMNSGCPALPVLLFRDHAACRCSGVSGDMQNLSRPPIADAVCCNPRHPGRRASLQG